ncbi:MAG: TraR/DksA C4-type zinc finger protein [Candidatus Hydrogenedentota bacterium]
MDSQTTDTIRQSLTDLRATVQAEKDAATESIAPVELDQARLGRLSRMDSMQQQAMAQEQDRRRDTQLKRIEGAFQRLDKGTYGNCVTCKEPISTERMEFDPTVFFCQACATKAERR